MTLGSQAFAYQSAGVGAVALHGRKTIRNNQAETHLVGNLAHYGRSGREYSGVTSAFYYGSCRGVQQHDVINAVVSNGTLEVICNANYTGGAYGFWVKHSNNSGEYVWSKNTGSLAVSLTYTMAASYMTSATISCYNIVYGYGWQGTVGAGEWS